MNTIVKEKDLNRVDYLNGSSQIDKDGNTVLTGLKGALGKYGGKFSFKTEMYFIWSKKRQIYKYLVEQFEYKNLPKGLTKYRIEHKNIMNGSVLIYKLGEEYYALNYKTLKFNIYDEPRKVKIVETRSVLNGKVIDLQNDKNAVIYRDNQEMVSTLNDVYRYLHSMEKVLFQMEKNITASAPKGIINLKDMNLAFEENEDNPEKQALERIINSQDTFYVLKSKALINKDINNDNEEPIFIPLQLEDRIDSLIKQYSFLKEEVKEMIGSRMNILNGKRERLITGEINSQNDLPNSATQHAYNIRMIDLEKINKLFGLNIILELVETEEEQETGDSDV